MKRQMIFGTMLSAAFAVGLAAQEPQQPPTPRQPAPTQPAEPRQRPTEPQPTNPVGTSGAEQSSSASQTVTLTGCVQAGNQMTGGAATAVLRDRRSRGDSVGLRPSVARLRPDAAPGTPALFAFRRSAT